MKKLLDNGTLVTLGLVGVVAAVGAANKAGLYGSRALLSASGLSKLTDAELEDYWESLSPSMRNTEAWHLAVTERNVREYRLPNGPAYAAFKASRRSRGSLNEGSAARGVTEGYVESYLDGDNIAISTFLGRHLRGKAKQFSGQYARRLKAALDAMVVSGEAYRDTTPNGAPSYRRTSSDSGTAGSAARRTPSQIRDEAAARNNEGDVEQCWFLHGKADAVEGLPLDPAQARDQEFGADYRA